MKYIKASDTPVEATNAIKIYETVDFEGMRKAGNLAARTLDMITPYVVPNVTTDELDQLCSKFVTEHGAINAPLNYNGYPNLFAHQLTTWFVTVFLVQKNLKKVILSI